MSQAQTTQNLQENTLRCIEITAKDLPLHCPMPNMVKWNAHPRVFLSIDKSGEVLCPYCGTRYKLNGPNAIKHH